MIANETTVRKALIFVVDDDVKLAQALCGMLNRLGYDAAPFQDGATALSAIPDRRPDVFLLDFVMPKLDGIGVLKQLREKWTNIPVIMMSDKAQIPNAVEALHLGALDFLVKPEDLAKRLEAAVITALKHGSLQRQVEHLRGELDRKYAMIGESAALAEVRDLIAKVAPSDATVLVLGESGTGKELVARKVHDLSLRRDRPFVVVHAAALPDTLLESELFGYEKGSFTGAVARKPGRLEAVDGGTLFCDEIGEISPALQVKILRFLQERTFVRLGGSQPVTVDCRIVAATNRNLEEDVRAGRFREDLYYRLSVFPIFVPPLRERRSDVPLLADHILKNLGCDAALEASVLDALSNYPWPGNVRELENVLERAWILAAKGRIETRHIQLPRITSDSTHPSSERWRNGPPDETLRSAKDWAERLAIKSALDQANGDVKRAAETLGVTPKCVYEKMKDLSIESA